VEVIQHGISHVKHYYHIIEVEKMKTEITNWKNLLSDKDNIINYYTVLFNPLFELGRYALFEVIVNIAIDWNIKFIKWFAC